METRVLQPAVSEHTGTAIHIDGLTKAYGDSVVVDDLTFDVPRNSIFGFLGPNGAGKTTTIKMLLGLAPPSRGGARILDLDIGGDSLAIRRRIGYLAQDPRFYPHLTARETLDFACRFFFSGPKAAIGHRIDETLHLVGLADKADRPIKGFSGGERQRLGIAQAQVNHPDLLILDEPAAALDPAGRRDVLEIMERLKAHATVFYSTHILEDVQRVSDHVAILDRGRLVTAAPTAQLLEGESAVYRIKVRGDGAAAVRALQGQPWVGEVGVGHDAGVTELLVTVADRTVAETGLLRTVMDVADTTVVDFGLKSSSLEDVFLGLVEGSRN